MLDREAAERAYQALRSRGYTDADINLMMSAATRENLFGAGPLAAAIAGAGAGGVTGGMIGAFNRRRHPGG